jgi:cholesterol oxidase
MATSKAYYDRVRQTMIDVAEQLGAEYRDNPLLTLKRLITVHPLGGCPMATSGQEGVVDPWLGVHGYPGLYVADGSVMPGPVGPNPSLTIAAMADRMALRIAEEGSLRSQGRRTVPTNQAGAEREESPGRAVSLEFTEDLKGFVTLGETDYQRGFARGKADGTACSYHLTIRTEDVDRFVGDPRHEGAARGWVECGSLGGRLPLEEGVFNLFVDDAEPDRTHMLYRLFFADGAGSPLTLSGYKDVHDDPGLDLWPDTSTLYTRILRGHVPVTEETGTHETGGGEAGAEVVAAGVLHLHLVDFTRLLASFRTHGPSLGARAQALQRFGELFLGKLWQIYGGQATDAAGAGGGDDG